MTRLSLTLTLDLDLDGVGCVISLSVADGLEHSLTSLLAWASVLTSNL
jgi:hypothetical protein